MSSWPASSWTALRQRPPRDQPTLVDGRGKRRDHRDRRLPGRVRGGRGFGASLALHRVDRHHRRQTHRRGANWAEAAAEREAQLIVAKQEQQEIATQPEAELDELVSYWESRGLSTELARRVADELMARDALTAQLESEHGFAEPMPADLPIWIGAAHDHIAHTCQTLAGVSEPDPETIEREQRLQADRCRAPSAPDRPAGRDVEHDSTSPPRRTACYNAAMATEISQRELRNDSGRIMRSLSSGETFTVTSNGEPVGELTPLRRRRFVSAAAVIATFRAAPTIDADRFRRDLDGVADQDIEPRG